MRGSATEKKRAAKMDPRAQGGIGAIAVLTILLAVVVVWFSEQQLLWGCAMMAAGAVVAAVMWTMARRGQYRPPMVWIASGLLLAASWACVRAAPTAAVLSYYAEEPRRRWMALAIAGVMVAVGVVSLLMVKREND